MTIVFTIARAPGRFRWLPGRLTGDWVHPRIYRWFTWNFSLEFK
jgi:hypothetical protein